MKPLEYDDLGNKGAGQQPFPKLRKSCELCRASKGRCCPSEEDPSRCQRCVRDGKQCTFLRPKPRPKRGNNSRVRVAAMEQKLDGIFALLSSGALPNKEGTPPVVTTSHPRGHEERTTGLLGLGTGVSPPSPPLSDNLKVYQHGSLAIFSLPATTSDDFNDVISRGILHFDEAEQSLRLFQTKAPSFPFVVVPPDVSLTSLRREKPFLLLAILACALQGQKKLRNAIELEIRESLSQKVVVNGEKSMDLLQGLLVYLCWYHFYFNHERQQFYQLCQMANAMAVDLGISHPAKQEPSLNCFETNDTRSHNLDTPRLLPENIEARRTLLGCYYLTSSLSQHLRKPNSLEYSEYLDECSQLLADVRAVETDYLLPYHLRLQQLAEEANRTFDYDHSRSLPQPDATRTELLLKSLQQQLKQIEVGFPTELWNNVSIATSYRALRIYVNEIAFHAGPPSPSKLMSDQLTRRSWYSSSARQDCLLTCLEATLGYMDHCLSLPAHAFLDFTAPEMIKLMYAAFVLGRFTTGCDAPLLDASSLRTTANLDYYLESFYNKFGELVTLGEDKECGDVFSQMRWFFGEFRQSYDLALRNTSSDDCVLYRPETSFMQIIPTICYRIDHREELLCGSTDLDIQWTDMMSGFFGSPGLDPLLVDGSLGRLG